MSKLNSPKIVIRYVVGAEISMSQTSIFDNNDFSRAGSITKNTFDMGGEEIQKYGKKGFFLSGGAVDPVTREESGCIMNGSYKFFDDVEKYPGIVGRVLSGDNYKFSSPQYVRVTTVNTGDVITALSIHFDNVAGEYATEIIFSNEPNKIYKNQKYVFAKTFKSEDNITSVDITFNKWSKKNSVAKLLKVTTTIIGEYDYSTIKSMDFSNEKISNEEEVSFGVTSQFCDISLIDRTGEIQALHDAHLLEGDILAKIYLVNSFEDGTQEETNIGTFYLSTYENEKGSNVWDYSMIDQLEKLKNIVVDPLEVGSRTIKQITDFILQKLGLSGSTSWSADAASYCSSITVPNSWIEPNQYAFDVLCKCCEVGLLRIFIDQVGGVRVERGL